MVYWETPEEARSGVLRYGRMKTREQVLHLLLERGKATIKELAEELGINPVSVRHHLLKLEAEGLVASQDERHGVGRPRRVYYLTEKGLARFPSRYVWLASQLLHHLKATVPRQLVTQVFIQMAQEMASQLEGLEEMTTEERLELLMQLLRREGFIVTWENQGDRYVVREIACPYLQLGHQHPEVCTLDSTLIAKVLDVDAERIQCMLTGDNECVYVIPKSQLEEQR